MCPLRPPRGPFKSVRGRTRLWDRLQKTPRMRDSYLGGILSGQVPLHVHPASPRLPLSPWGVHPQLRSSLLPAKPPEMSPGPNPSLPPRNPSSSLRLSDPWPGLSGPREAATGGWPGRPAQPHPYAVDGAAWRPPGTDKGCSAAGPAPCQLHFARRPGGLDAAAWCLFHQAEPSARFSGRSGAPRILRASHLPLFSDPLYQLPARLQVAALRPGKPGSPRP